jgi:protease-4
LSGQFWWFRSNHSQNNSVIVLNLEDIKYDYAGKYEDPDLYFADKKSVGPTDVIKAIEDAKTDDDIKGISILNNQSTLGMAQSKALRDELLSFKNQGNL